MGSTIATTGLDGDRLDEYEYTDYGVPMHAPVALDGKWISNIQADAAYTVYDDVSKITLSAAGLVDTNALTGCEIRVPLGDSATYTSTFAAGTVIMHGKDLVYIHDPGHAVASAWTSGSDQSRAASAIYDLREGFRKGVMNDSQTGGFTSGDGWNHEPATFIVAGSADIAPFESWMTSQPGITPQEVWIGPGPGGWGDGPGRGGDFRRVTVLGVAAGGTDGGFRRLAIQGQDHDDYIGWGKWYFVDGRRKGLETAQSGTWAGDATFSDVGGVQRTTFTLDKQAYLPKNTEGWHVQPDVNIPAFAPIVDVSTGSSPTVTVSGRYDSIGQAGTRFRIFAPPGVNRNNVFGLANDPDAGWLSKWVSSESSRCLYKGYRFESPLAGLRVGGSQVVVGGQTGANYGGMYYTLHRHYDPVFMRFTSPDPLAAPFYNLYHYAGNNPAAYYDPDGLVPISIVTGAQRAARVAKRVWDFLNDPELERGFQDGSGDGLKEGWKSFLGPFLGGDNFITTATWDYEVMKVKWGHDAERFSEVIETHGGGAAAWWLVFHHLGHRELVEAGLGMDPDPYEYGYRRGYTAGQAQWAVAAAPAVIVMRGAHLRVSRVGRGRTVIGKTKDLQRLRPGDNSLLRHLPDQGSPKANWKQNASVLRREMRKGRPIRDASVDPVTGDLLEYPGSFLDAERRLLRNGGWTYDPHTRLWRPPK
jgi:RHS repeat-associated protein